MAKIKNLIKKIISKLSYWYIDFVYKTSKVTRDLNFDTYLEENEYIVAIFWHGFSYTLLPGIEGQKVQILATEDERGDYIEYMANRFGAQAFRVPDFETSGSHLLEMVKFLKGAQAHVAVAGDGPLGPIYEVKDLPFILAQLTKRRIMPMSIEIKRSIILKKRWDKYKIPLPFNVIKITGGKPIAITKSDRQDDFKALKERVRQAIIR